MAYFNLDCNMMMMMMMMMLSACVLVHFYTFTGQARFHKVICL